MANYEFTAIYDATKTDEDIRKAIDGVRNVLLKNNAEITYVEEWGRRKLAYEIAGKFEGYYVIFYFRAPPGQTLKNDLTLFSRVNDILIRHLLVTVPKLKTEADAKREQDARDAERKSREEAAQRERQRAEDAAKAAAEAEAAKAAAEAAPAVAAEEAEPVAEPAEEAKPVAEPAEEAKPQPDAEKKPEAESTETEPVKED